MMNEQQIQPPADALLLEPFDPIAAGQKLEQETVFFEFHTSRPGFTKSIPPSTFLRKIKEAGEGALTPEQEVQLNSLRAQIQQTQTADGKQSKETDPSMLHVAQDILDRGEIRKIAHHDSKFKLYLLSIAIPCPVRFAGAYLVSHKRIEEVETRIEAYLAQRILLIQAFQEKYLERKEQAKTRRWPFFDEADYPEWSTIEGQYQADFSWVSFNVPAALAKINNAIYEKAKQKAKLKWADAVQEARDAQRVALQTLLDNFTEMLSNDESTGKRKKFKPSAVKKLQDFLTMFEEMNLTGDLELAQIVSKTKDVVAGIDSTSLKKDMSMRDVMLDSVSKLKAQAKTLVVVRERKVVFEDEEDVEDTLALVE